MSEPITVADWRCSELPEDLATPPCPKCGRSLGIRDAMWTDTGRDMWLCETCGEFAAAAPQGKESGT